MGLKTMTRIRTAALALWVVAAMAPAPVLGREASGARHFVYVSDKRIVTLELPLDKNKAILNYINLDDVVELIDASGLLVLDAEGGGHLGHLILKEDADPSEGLYQVSVLVKPKQYRGYDILGDFRFASPPERAYLRLGSRIVRLQPLDDEEFEVEAAKISRVDLSAEPKFALADAGFWRGMGDLYFADDPESDELQSRFPGAGPRPPILVANPAPRLPEKWKALPDPVIVTLRVGVTAQGALVKLEVIEGVNPELDRQALETVRNSWRFLPAVANAEPAGAEMVLNVVFDR